MRLSVSPEVVAVVVLVCLTVAIVMGHDSKLVDALVAVSVALLGHGFWQQIRRGRNDRIRTDRGGDEG